jgi:hypothetical protein
MVTMKLGSSGVGYRPVGKQWEGGNAGLDLSISTPDDPIACGAEVGADFAPVRIAG